jgi:hypothetical protein
MGRLAAPVLEALSGLATGGVARPVLLTRV